MLANLRRYWALSKHSTIIQSRFGRLWQDIRHTTKFTSEIYSRIKEIAIKKGIEIPQPKVDMSVETS